jgi:hypothetical protein
MNCLFIACNHGVQVGLDALTVIETPYCTQQTGGLTRGMILRPVRGSGCVGGLAVAPPAARGPPAHFPDHNAIRL